MTGENVFAVLQRWTKSVGKKNLARLTRLGLKAEKER